MPAAGETYVIDAHRNHRGPYSAAGEFVRLVFASACTSAPDLINDHLLTLLSVAPELRRDFAVPADIDASFAYSREGNARSWSLRLAHGVTDFLLAYFQRISPTGNSVRFEHADHADPVDQELFAVLLRRADPQRLLVCVCCAAEPLPGSLAGADGSPADSLLRLSPAEVEAAARAYIDSDCCTDNPIWKHAYDTLPEAARRALHLARAVELEALGQPSLALGAIPFHRMRAADGVSSLLFASSQCMRMALYDAALEWARRGRAMIDPAVQRRECGELTRNILFALLLLGRYDEAEAVSREVQASEPDPALLAHVTYAMAILNARLYDPSRHDYDAAKVWVEQSLAFTDRLPASETREVNRAFLMNTMALVEMRKGHHAAALDLLTAGLAHMAALAPGRYPAECEILLHNRARLQIANGRFDQAIDDFATLLRFEPSNSDALFDRGLLHQRSRRYQEALADYDATIRWSPPYWEPHFNRAQTLVALGRGEAALADYDRVLTLKPDHAEAHINRACLCFDLGRSDQAQADLDTALQLEPGNARALCLRGLLEMQREDYAAAERSFAEAIAADPALPDAWANRATLRFKQGDPDAALLDLDRATELRADDAILYNRGRMLEAQRRWREAIDDYQRALTLATGATDHIRRHLESCRREIAQAS